MRFYPTRDQIRQSWEKYGLIVVGNIVFFALLYFISYRPNNDENRAAEFLSMAQAQETSGFNEAAMVLYEKVVAGYPDTAAARTAATRLPVVRRVLALPERPAPEAVEPMLDLESMLARKPSVYIAAFLARHYDERSVHRAKIREAIEKHLWIAANSEGMDLRALSREKEFQSEVFQREFFAVRPRCVMEPDWVWDDFLLKNTNFFEWTNVNVKMTVEQGGRRAQAEQRIPRVGPGETVEMLEFGVKGSEGVVGCAVEVTSEQGTAAVDRKL
jgi:hypothetical protein